MSDDLVNITVDGVALKARKGQMIMQATDREQIYIPRFCYHEKLSVAANCRMCLVEVEKAPKPLPACATPVTEGMKVFTRSPRAISAQKATMEFLLINHPLDCPICDQGGECELQDLAMGFGRDISRFAERKRVVKDKNLGPLVSTDMTRCIHCTRCVRFGQEIQGFPQLGTTGRGEHMQITTYVEQSVDHELSANIIDLCPVGALNNKPFRYQGRSWEMTQHGLISPHDPVGSNLYAHVLRGRLMRIVPRQNDEINETWIADRDRFGFEGIYAQDRVREPLLRSGGELRPVDWDGALQAAAAGLRRAAAAAGAPPGFLASPSSTLEEFYLLGKIARGLGVNHIDHRLRQLDFRGEDAEGPYPGFGLAFADIERLQGILVIAADLRGEVPLLAHRVRKAAIGGGAKVAFLNPQHYPYLFPVAHYALAGANLPAELQAVLRAAAEAASKPVPEMAGEAQVRDSHRALAAALMNGERRAILIGQLGQRHPAYAQIKILAQALAALAGASLGLITEGANAAGAYLAGAVPHRAAGAQSLAQPGLNARAMLDNPMGAYLLFGAIDPDLDLARGGSALAGSEFVVAATSHLSASLRALAHLVLPIGAFAETSGTFVNGAGRWQSWAGAIKPFGEARPGWKVLRVLGNLLDLPQFDYTSSEEVRAAVHEQCRPFADATPGSIALTGSAPWIGAAAAPRGEWVSIPSYAGDALARRSAALAKTGEGQTAPAVI